MSDKEPRPKNDPEHRKARKAAGLTSCMTCKDKGTVMRHWAAGMGRIGYRCWSENCPACRCYWCGNYCEDHNGTCKECEQRFHVPRRSVWRCSES